MTAQLLPWPLAKFFQPNTNLPLSGGKVYTYQAGTSTPQVTYSDYAGTIPNTNPVILDANGQASIYLGTGLSYKINVLDASNVQLPDYPIDNISGNDPTLRADLASTNPALGASLVGFIQPLSGAIASTVYRELTQKIVNVFDFMTSAQVADVKTRAYTLDVTAACNSALAVSKCVYFPAGSYKITSALTLNASDIQILGDGIGQTILKASGNYTSLLSIGASSSDINVNSLSIDTSGTTTECVNIAVLSGGANIRFSNVAVSGDLTGDLIYSNGQNLFFSNCSFYTKSGSTWGLNLDCYNQNTTIIGGSITGTGQGIRITNALTPGSNRVEGTKIIGLWSTCTGATSIEINNSFVTQIIGCTLDQAATYGIHVLGGADAVTIDGGYVGLANTGANNIWFEATAGSGHYIGSGLNIYGGNTGIVISATAGANISDVDINGVIFLNCSLAALQLDSVDRCVITNCIDRSTNPTSGSWNTLTTHVGHGKYTFDNNAWHTNTQVSVSTATYKYGFDTGLVYRNEGTVSPGSGTSITVNHGLAAAPTKVQVTPQTNSGTFFWNTPTSTQFTITWATSGAQTFSWSASL